MLELLVVAACGLHFGTPAALPRICAHPRPGLLRIRQPVCQADEADAGKPKPLAPLIARVPVYAAINVGTIRALLAWAPLPATAMRVSAFGFVAFFSSWLSGLVGCFPRAHSQFIARSS